MDLKKRKKLKKHSDPIDCAEKTCREHVKIQSDESSSEDSISIEDSNNFNEKPEYSEDERESEKKVENLNYWSVSKCFMLICLVVFGGYGLYLDLNSQSSIQMKIFTIFERHYFDLFFNQPEETADNLMEQFYNEGLIPRETIRIGTTALEKALKDNSVVALLLIGETSQHKNLLEISEKIANFTILVKKRNSFPLYHLNESFKREIIEEIYDKTFSKPPSPILVLHDLQNMPNQIAITFHQYFDEDQSKYIPNFSIITLATELKRWKVTANSTINENEKITTQVLEELWQDAMDKNILDCLINRIGQYSMILTNVNQ